MSGRGRHLSPGSYLQVCCLSHPALSAMLSSLLLVPQQSPIFSSRSFPCADAPAATSPELPRPPGPFSTLAFAKHPVVHNTTHNMSCPTDFPNCDFSPRQEHLHLLVHARRQPQVPRVSCKMSDCSNQAETGTELAQLWSLGNRELYPPRLVFVYFFSQALSLLSL